ncbi:LacI family transcriptional regulator [Microcella alkaliphila]|uniref:LacI family transcriptional regulator n=1 Tax=Microcella alkaliphila TaxID=279828 RepID=A0A4Q7TIY4_9MICO|nr:LacI family DNA-binding transcriptional regulator [Microcella alkaliphila]RZT59570.1 LacI family transcriptional regulator [Microcella alkaliphila]
MATSRAVSVKDVAGRARVSVGTVSNVLNRPEKVAPATVARVQHAISELGFIRNDAARQLRAGKSRALGLIVLDVRNPFFSSLALGAEDRAREAGYSIILGNSDEKVERESAYLDLFEEQRMAGVLISPFGDVDDRLVRLRERGTPAVLVDRSTASAGFSSVAVDDVAGGVLAGRHLLDTGRRRIAFVGGPIDIRQVHDRLTGLQEAASSVPDAEIEVLLGDSLSIIEGRRLGDELAARPVAQRPDAIFAANDLMAIGVLQALVMLGSIRVPDDIALVGYDDIEFASGAVVPLTSVRQPAGLIGSTAVEILLDEALNDATPGRSVVFQPELVVRASTTA